MRNELKHEYYLRNREKMLENGKRYYYSNKDKTKKYNKTRYLKNKQKRALLEVQGKKQCFRCKEVKSLECFQKKAKYHITYCRICQSILQQGYNIKRHNNYGKMTLIPNVEYTRPSIIINNHNTGTPDWYEVIRQNVCNGWNTALQGLTQDQIDVWYDILEAKVIERYPNMPNNETYNEYQRQWKLKNKDKIKRYSQENIEKRRRYAAAKNKIDFDLL